MWGAAIRPPQIVEKTLFFDNSRLGWLFTASAKIGYYCGKSAVLPA